MQTILLTPPAHAAPPCSIMIGENARTALPDLLKTLDSADGAVVLYDKAIDALAKEIATTIGTTKMIAVASGEGSKSLQETERIAEEMLQQHVSRKSVLVCVGGGMLTDLGAFVGSIYMRGIRFVLVPTSLLAMVDAAIGGKTGVDAGAQKNILGTITHPAGVVMDLSVLKSLPDRQLREGLVEVIKMAAMLDLVVFEWLETHLDVVLARSPAPLEQCIAHAVKMKVAVVEADEKERSTRMFLNFGHTIGHAVESLSNFAIAHGTAVGIGMIEEMRLAKCPDSERITKLLARLELPMEMPKDQKRTDLWAMMENDKKTSGGIVRMAVPKTLGTGEVVPLSKEAFLTQ